jgi:hypothetical protein
VDKQVLGMSIVTVVVVGVLMLLVHSSRAEAQQDERGFVLHYSGMWKGLVKLLFLFPATIAVICLFNPPTPQEWWIPYAIIGGFLAIHVPLTLEVLRRQVRVEAEGLHSSSPWGAPRFMAWKDVAEVSWKAAAGEVELRSTRGERLRVSLWLSGLGSLAKAMTEHLPHLTSAQQVSRTLAGHAARGI